MTTMTIHADETFADALRAYAQRAGTSVNKTVQTLLAPLIGLAERKDTAGQNPFMKFCGILPNGEGERLAKAVEAQRAIDAEMWE